MKQPPRLIAGDALALVSGVTGTPASCTDLSSADYIEMGDSAYLCIPIASNPDGIASIDITSVRQQWSDDEGGATEVEVFAPVSLDLGGRSDRIIRLPRLEPTDQQAPGSFSVRVRVTTTEEVSGDFYLTSRLRSVPGVSFINPEDGAAFYPGETIVAEVGISNPAGIKLVRATWDGVVSHPAVANLPGLPTDTTISFALPIPAATSAGDVSLTIIAEDADGVANTPARRTFVVAETPVDSDAPAIRAHGPVGPLLTRGTEFTLEASDASALARIGYVAIDDAGTVLFGDSVDVAANVLVQQAFVINHPIGTPYGRINIVPFAEDTLGNRGWMASPTEDLPGVADIKQARSYSATLAIGQVIAHTRAGHLGAQVVHPSRQEIYITNQQDNRIERFDIATGAFLSPVSVRSKPDGIALVPAPGGDATTTLLVANSGGDEISFVDVASGTQENIVSVPAIRLATSGTEYPMTDRLADLAVSCRDATCTDYWLYATSVTTGAQRNTTIRVFPMPSATQVHLDSVDVIAPSDPSGTTMTLSTVKPFIDEPRDTVWTLGNISTAATVHSNEGVILQTVNGAAGKLFIGQRNGSFEDPEHARVMVIDTETTASAPPRFNNPAIDVLTANYTKQAGGIRQMDTNGDGSMLAFTTPVHVVITNDQLTPKAMITASGANATAPEHLAFLRDQVGDFQRPEDGGLLAIARVTEPYIDLYSMETFDLLISLPVPERVRGQMDFFRTDSEGNLAIVAATQNGLMIVRTSIAEIIALSEN